MEVSILNDFADSLRKKFSLPGTASPEDQLKGPVATLLQNAGATFGLKVESRTEPSLVEHKVRPDIAIYVERLICGYIELKAPGVGADVRRLKGKHNKEQWNKLKALPNLIYTDGREWALYRSGKRQGSIVRLDDDPSERGRKAVSQANLTELIPLLRDFLLWQPIVPQRPEQLAPYLAQLARFLRTEIEAALARPQSAASLLAAEWRQYFFPEADNAQFADSYAQTVSYALLLARLSGADDLDPTVASSHLGRNNGVLAVALDRLGQKEAREELRVGFELLQRSLGALDPKEFLKTGPDVWLYFYENFLAAYDPKLRKKYGVYYTPRAVVELQVRLVGELLETNFRKKLGFADDGVVVVDPAVGTGTYPIAVVKHGLAKVRERYGAGAVASRAAQMARNIYGFEILIGPYAVAHLRLTQALESEGATIGDRLNIFLADTLESPNAEPHGTLSLTYKVVTEEHKAARKIKSKGEILVCLGNPPYDRQHIEENDEVSRRKGGWVRFADQVEGGAPQENQGDRPILKDFTDPAKEAGASVHIKNLYNDYVYFWRWALWRMFERQESGGVISFITASSYLAGPGFIGMRERMRRTFDALWIIDLGGDNLGTRKTPNVFAIQSPVAIAIGWRGAKAQPGKPATVYFARIGGENRDEKLNRLNRISEFASLDWKTCPSGWHDPFLPEGGGDFFAWPELADLFPWQHSGVQFKRTWPIGETEEVLTRRMGRLIASNTEERKLLFKETDARRINVGPKDVSGSRLESVSNMTSESDFPEPRRYCYRQFDRQYALIDNRFGDRIRPPLVLAAGEDNLFFCSLMTKVLGVGAAIGVSADIPDLHTFCGRGGKDVIPLYRDSDCTEPNIAAGLLDFLASHFGEEPKLEDFAAYVYALLGGQSYTRRYWNELETPGPRVPITRDGALFRKTAALGRQLVWLHTYADRFHGEGLGQTVPRGKARCTASVSDDPSCYPEESTFLEDEEAIRVGSGRFEPVENEVWAFEVSGLKIVDSWLSYRMKVRAGKKSSPLDEIRPIRWTGRMTEEFLELLWIIEATLEMEPELEQALDSVVSSPCFEASELPQAIPSQRKEPRTPKANGRNQDLFNEGGDERTNLSDRRGR